MREKNVLRAADALFVSQGDDKNKVLASFIDNKEVRARVKDQGRCLLILERLVLPTGKFSYTKEEMHLALLNKLKKKGHRIQEDDAPDDEEYAKEKQQFIEERQAMVGDILGKTVEQVEKESQEPEVELTEEENQELEEAQKIQKQLLDDLPEVPEVEDAEEREFYSLIGRAFMAGMQYHP